MAVMDEAKSFATSTGRLLSGKAKETLEITRLSVESHNTTNALNSVYAQIGRIYVETDAADTASMDLLKEQAREFQKKIADLEERKLSIRARNRCPMCGKVMPRAARFCSSCGAQMPSETVPAANRPPVIRETVPAPDPAPAPEPALEKPDHSAEIGVTRCPQCGAQRKRKTMFCHVCGYSYDTPPEDNETNIPSDSSVPSLDTFFKQEE